jgi:hypothetical protein
MEAHTNAHPRRVRTCRRAVILAAVFAGGLAAGVALERRLQGLTPPRGLAPWERLHGRWAAEQGDGHVAFRPDGTFDVVKVMRGAQPGSPPPGSVQTVSGSYRWLDGERIELALPHSTARQRVRLRVIIRDDDLTLIGEDGDVTRGKRQR